MLYSLNEYTIIPATITEIEHRNECNPYYSGKKLPLFAAPMSSVLNSQNYHKFEEVGISVVLPRTLPIKERLKLCKERFCAFSLDEATCHFISLESEIEEEKKNGTKFYVCIDVANGHMKKLLDLCELLKDLWGDHLILMTGNIARASTYIEYAKRGVDYVRVGIGSGNVCTTSSNTGVHCPMGSLLMDLNVCIESLSYSEIKHRPLIIADGGFSNFDQIIKALALGADYVMLGQILASSEEACGEENHIFKVQAEWTPEEKKHLTWDANEKHYYLRMREYYGMSTKQAQMEMGKKGDKTSEGICKLVYIDYTIKTWVDNFISYLRSAMSYSNCRSLKAFKENADCRVMTVNSYQSYFK